MKTLLAAIIASLYGMLFVTGAAAQKADPAVYGALPNVTEVALSPDGNTLALLQNFNGTSALIFREINSPNAEPSGVRLGNPNARNIQWADNEYILLLMSESSEVSTSSGLQTIEFFRWASISKSKQKATILFGNERGYFLPSPGTIVSILPDEPGNVLFARYTPKGGDITVFSSRIKDTNTFGYSLFKVDLRNGRKQKIENTNENTVDWIVNEKGKPVVRVDYLEQQKKRKFYVKDSETGRYELLAEFDEEPGAGAKLTLQGLSRKEGVALATTYGGKDKRSLVEFDLRSGEQGATIFSNENYDIDSIIYDPYAAKVTGVRYTEDLPNTYHLDEGARSIQASLEGALTNASPVITSTSADGDRMIVGASYSNNPKRFFLFDKNANTLAMIASSYSTLDGKATAKKSKYDYVSSDGMLIHGYLTTPSQTSPSSMPLIVLPHGGPWSRDDQAFDWWSFFYAARGYLVYQPNFRGSDGYGANFKLAGDGEWGRKMQDDITEGVQKLIAEGRVDPDRICIVGASYGGYAALAGATLTPDLYACTVSVNGVSNLLGMLGTEARESERLGAYWERRIGSRFKDVDKLRAVSPTYQAANAKAPILLIQSKDDTVVPVGQGRLMRDALIAAGKPYEYVELKGEDHWLSTSKMRTEMLRRSIDFIDKHIGE